MSRAIIEKTSGKDAVFNAGNVRSEVAHREDVVTDESHRADRRIIAQLDSSINVLHQIGTVGIHRPRGTDPDLSVRWWNAENQNRYCSQTQK
jgi:hypothetical protein